MCSPNTNPLIDRKDYACLWSHISIDEVLHRCVENFPLRTSLISTGNDILVSLCGLSKLTYSQLDYLVDQLAHKLRNYNLPSHSNIMAHLPNSSDAVLFFFAVIRAGHVPVLTLPTYQIHELSHCLGISQPAAFMCTTSNISIFDNLQSGEHDLTKSLRLIVWEDFLDVVDQETIHKYAHQPYNSTRNSSLSSIADDLALLLVSGGSTGLPKLIPRTHNDYIYNAQECSTVCQLSNNDVFLVCLPAFHNFSLCCPGILGTFLHGGAVAIAETPSPDECFSLIERHKVTLTALTPPVATLWSAATAWEQADLQSLRLIQVGGAKMSPELATSLRDTFPYATVQQVFGMAEGTIFMTRIDDSPERILHTQGAAISSYDDVVIVDSNQQPVGTDVPGELLCRGPYTIREYYRAPQANISSFTSDGYYRSGDKVSIDVHGYVTHHGRVSDTVNRGGESISCIEVEQTIAQHPAIQHCAVIGQADTYLGEKILAIVDVNAPLELSAVKEFLHTQGLAHFKHPDALVIIDSMPLTPAGKIDKKALKNTYGGGL